MKLHAGRAFDHVLVIMFENMYRGYVLANPYMRRLARRGVQLGNYFGVMHPSQTNYIASTAGALCNVTSDGRPPLLAERTIVDLIEEAPGDLRWKAYMESYVPQAQPWSPSFTPEDANPYVVKHNPFSSFASIIRSEARWRCVENEAALFSDLLNGTLPEYAWFTPNMWNDGHWIDGTTEESNPRAPALVDQLARWLEGLFDRLRFPGPRSHLPPNTMVVVTFDESDFETDYRPDLASAYDGPNQIYTVLLGDHLEPGFETEGYNHYSLLRTIEKNFDLEHLGKNDADANWFQFLWGRRFRWSGPCATPIGTEGVGGLAAAGFAGALFVTYAGVDGALHVRTRTVSAGDGSAAAGAWSAPVVLPVDGSGGAALASTFDQLVLVARSAAGELSCLTYDLQAGWSAAPKRVGKGRVAAFALQSFARETQIMLATADASGAVTTRIRTARGWKAEVPVAAAQTCPQAGALTMGSLGHALYLLALAPDGASINVVSYNTAPYNVVIVPPNQYGGPQDNTTQDTWSPSAFPVAHFSARPDVNAKRQPDARPYASCGPLALASLDGVMHLVHPGPGNPVLLTETFSIAGVMTPAEPVSYKSYDSATASNGFGTLVEAGWSKQSALFDAHCAPGGEVCVGRAGAELVMLVRPRPGAPVELRVGRY